MKHSNKLKQILHRNLKQKLSELNENRWTTCTKVLLCLALLIGVSMIGGGAGCYSRMTDRPYLKNAPVHLIIGGSFLLFFAVTTQFEDKKSQWKTGTLIFLCCGFLSNVIITFYFLLKYASR